MERVGVREGQSKGRGQDAGKGEQGGEVGVSDRR